ncbi:unnamed protein product [Cylindrotheca closterium]|uniref:AB hydrolase-1 domain-containing protein n=1 Tax=Cylindrotheca closterium TaxID=2856 RepID=A0AAD2FZV2_9STRA|nr:unnamed protein product [Cylindrotheca closterium]
MTILCAVWSYYQETHVQVADEVFLHTLEYGDFKSGTAPVVLLVHGFPDLSISWQYQAEKLARAGYFVVTPDLRGFGNSTMSTTLAAYGRKNLVSDMDALRKHYCGNNGSFAMIAGHDWGGTIVYAALDAFGLVAVDDSPPIAKCAVIFNAPHSRIFFQYLTKPKQAIKSWYMFFFQIPWLPEVFLTETKALYHLVAYHYETPMKSIVPSVDYVDKNLAMYREVLTDWDRIHAMLSYYRSVKSGLWRELGDTSDFSILERLIQWLHGIERNDKQDNNCQTATVSGDETNDVKIAVPILVLWGDKDIALSNDMAAPPKEIVETYSIEYLDAGHCPHWDKPLETAERLIRFTNAHNGRGGTTVKVLD